MLALGREQANGRTSSAVLEEVWHLELSGRVRGLDGLAARTHALMRPVLLITDDVIDRAFAIHAPRLGANDRFHAATCLVNGIATIVTADTDFDGLEGLGRVDPLDAVGIERLLAE
jgi:predicted nucleic acid-binding protein